jgi:hypothetical protein
MQISKMNSLIPSPLPVEPFFGSNTICFYVSAGRPAREADTDQKTHRAFAGHTNQNEDCAKGIQ